MEEQGKEAKVVKVEKAELELMTGIVDLEEME